MIKRTILGLVAAFSIAAFAAPAASQGISQKTATCDPSFPNRCVKPNADGSINLNGSISVSSAATATADPPTYTEGQIAPLSMDLSGKLRTDATGGGGGSLDAVATAAAPTYGEGANEPLSMNLAGDLRTLSKQSGVWDIGTVTAVSTISLPVGIKGADGSGIVANGNPLPVSDGGGSITVDGTINAVQSGGWNIGNITGTVSLPTGASTAALQGTGNTSLATIATNTGAATPAGSNIIGRVGIDQTTPGATNLVSAAQSGTWNLTNVSGTISLPTGAATAAKQDTEISSLASIVTNTTGLATVAAQTTGNGYLATIATAAADTNPADVNITEVLGSPIVVGSGSATGALRVELANNGAGTVGLNAGSNVIGAVTQSGSWTIAAGTATVGKVNLAATTTGGCTLSGTISTASTNATNIKASAGTLCGGMVINVTGTLAYMRLYNLASAPTCSSATGFVATIPVPASTNGAGTLISLGPFGANFSTGISFCITGGGASTDNTNAVAGVYANLTYN